MTLSTTDLGPEYKLYFGPSADTSKQGEDDMSSSETVEGDIRAHPVWKIIVNYGTKDERQAYLAFLVYMDLCEAKGWWNMTTHVSRDLDMVYLSGHENRSKPREIILPISVDTVISPAQIQRYLTTLEKGAESAEAMELILGICGSDSSTVYYKVTDGLVLPESPEMSEWKRYRREEKPKLQREHICKQRDQYVKNMDEKT